MEYTATQSSVNPPLNVDFGNIVDRLAITYENITKARLEANNPPKNPPPGSYSYNPQSDTKALVMNPAPGTLPAASSSVSFAAMVPAWVWIAGGFVVLLLFGGLTLGRRG